MEIPFFELLTTSCTFSKKQEGYFKNEWGRRSFFLSIKSLPRLFPSGIADLRLSGLYFHVAEKATYLTFMTEQDPEGDLASWDKFVSMKTDSPRSYTPEESDSLENPPKKARQEYDFILFHLTLNGVTKSYVKEWMAMSPSPFVIKKKDDTTYTMLATKGDFEVFFEFSSVSEDEDGIEIGKKR